MQLIKRKILLEDSIDRNYGSSHYGELTASTFYVKLPIFQNADDMGMFTDIIYIPNDGLNAPPDYTILIDKLNLSGFTFPFMTGGTPTSAATDYQFVLRLTGTTEEDYYRFFDLHITAATDSKLVDTKSYLTNQPYIVNFDTQKETYVNYDGVSVDGVNRVTALGEPIAYVFDTDETDPNIGTTGQTSGLLYLDYSGKTRTIINNDIQEVIPLTTVDYTGEGWNETNVSISALTKEEYLFGITSPPKIESDVFIDRGVTSVMDKHLRLSEVITLDELSRYGNGFYKLNKQ